MELLKQDIKSQDIKAGSFLVGIEYTIVSVGTTDFTLIGASANSEGVVFTATGVGSGNGVAYYNGFLSSNITESIPRWNAYNVTAGSFTIGVTYTITFVGTTNFVAIGASANTIGVVFTATGVGSGTGKARTTYLSGQYVSLGTYIYRSVDTNTNQSPLLSEGVHWVKYQVSNKYAMLDLSAQSKSYYVGGNIVVTFLQNQMTALAIGNYEAETILVEILSSAGSVLWSYETDNTINDFVTDYWSYIYEDYTYEVDRATKIVLGYAGYKVRVTFKKATYTDRTACGFIVGGTPYSMGETTDTVNFKFNSFALKSTDDFGTLTVIKRSVQDIVDFQTVINSNEIPTIKRKIKEIYNDIMVFIVDESDTSEYENIITLGIVESASVILNEFDKTTLTWSVIEAI